MAHDKLLYLDCASGIAGDMMLASLIDAGLNPKNLEKKIQSALRLNDWCFQISRVQKHHWPAHSLTIKGSKKALGGTREFIRIVSRSRFPPDIRKKSLSALHKMWNAERKVHGRLPDSYHHTEEGLFSLDTLIDITGNLWALRMLGIETVKNSPPNVGSGAPATLEILKANGLPFWTSGEPLELTTPTGAALLVTLTEGSGPCPPMTLESSGLGAGHKERKEAPNVLRSYIGVPLSHKMIFGNRSILEEDLVLAETNIDDMDPRLVPHVVERLIQSGTALDAWVTQILMKKGRPAFQISCLLKPQNTSPTLDLLFNETTTLGARILPLKRYSLPRRQHGSLKYKPAGDGTWHGRLEYEAAHREAKKQKIPLKDILK